MISIIIPVYNAEKELPECLDSILCETEVAYEIIAINDGSSDGSGAVLDDYAKQYPHLHVYHQENQGNSLTRDMGISYAKGDYILFVDADDTLKENALRIIQKALGEEPDILAFGYEIAYVDEHYHVTKTLPNKTYESGKDAVNLFLKHGSFNLLWNKVYKTSILQNHHDFPKMKTTGQDFIFNCHVFPRAKDIQSIEEVLYCYKKRAKETMVTRYIEDGYHNLEIKKEALDGMMKMLQCENNDAYKQYMLQEYEVYLLNFFAKNASRSKADIIQEVQENLLNDTTYDLIMSAHTEDAYAKLFQDTIKTRDAKKIVQKYARLTYIRDHFGSLYRKLRKRLNKAHSV